MGVGGQRHTPAALPPGKRPGTHWIGGCVGPQGLWTGAENLAPTGIRAPDRPAHSKLVYWLSYPGPPLYSVIQKDGLNFVSLYFKIRTSDKYDVNYIQLEVECWNEDETHAAQQSPTQF